MEASNDSQSDDDGEELPLNDDPPTTVGKKEKKGKSVRNGNLEVIQMQRGQDRQDIHRVKQWAPGVIPMIQTDRYRHRLQNKPTAGPAKAGKKKAKLKSSFIDRAVTECFAGN